MRLPGSARIQQCIQAVANRFRKRAVVLLYHRIGPVAGDPQLLNVSTERFAQHMEYVRRHYPVVSVGRLAEVLEGGEDIPDHSVAVTFDDGYVDNVFNAMPVLEQARIPATVFVTSGYLDQDQEFWWDELERILLYPSILPSQLQVQVGAHRCEYDLAGAEVYTESDALRNYSWNVLSRNNPTVRHQAYRELCAMFRALSPSEQGVAMNTIRSWSGGGGSTRHTHRCMSSEELRVLGASRFVSVGAHSVCHPVLSSLPLHSQRLEIQKSKRDLEERLGREVLCFAYPYGTKGDYSHETVKIVREEGFAAACANYEETTVRSTDRFQLPRVVVRDWPIDVFARALRKWVGRTGEMA